MDKNFYILKRLDTKRAEARNPKSQLPTLSSIWRMSSTVPRTRLGRTQRMWSNSSLLLCLLVWCRPKLSTLASARKGRMSGKLKREAGSINLAERSRKIRSRSRRHRVMDHPWFELLILNTMGSSTPGGLGLEIRVEDWGGTMMDPFFQQPFTRVRQIL